LAHLRENLAAAELNLPDEVRQRLDGLTSQVAN
jgi:aryl-alcohol dehydrogenase-like predicted oxidoreductase